MENVISKYYSSKILSILIVIIIIYLYVYSEGKETRAAQEVDTFNVRNAFSLAISIGCVGEEDYDKRWAAIQGTIEVFMITFRYFCTFWPRFIPHSFPIPFSLYTILTR